MARTISNKAKKELKSSGQSAYKIAHAARIARKAKQRKRVKG